MMRVLGIIVALGLGSGVPRPAVVAAHTITAPQAEGVDAEYVRGVVGRAAAHVEAGRYERALAVLDEAERTRPHAVFVYVRATIEERRGDCERAAALYRRFLELDVPEDDAEDARRGVARCRGEAPLEATAEPEASAGATEVPAPEGSPSSDSPSEPPPPSRPWIADPWGGVLVASGAVGLGVGVGLYARGRADERASRRATSLQSFDELARRAVTLDRAGIVTLALGSALLIGGVVRYALVATRPRRRARTATLWPSGMLVLRF